MVTVVHASASTGIQRGKPGGTPGVRPAPPPPPRPPSTVETIKADREAPQRGRGGGTAGFAGVWVPDPAAIPTQPAGGTGGGGGRAGGGVGPLVVKQSDDVLTV